MNTLCQPPKRPLLEPFKAFQERVKGPKAVAERAFRAV